MPLADMLAAGALQSVVQWLITGRTDDDIRARLRERFPGERSNSVNAVLGRGLAATNAGAGYGLSGPNQAPNLSAIPVNPNRPTRGNQRNRRFQYRATVTYGAGTNRERSFTIFRQSDTLLTTSQLASELRSRSRDLYQRASRGDQYSPYAQDETPDIDIISVERLY